MNNPKTLPKLPPLPNLTVVKSLEQHRKMVEQNKAAALEQLLAIQLILSKHTR